ncbi:MAG: hypothetical protein RLZ25_926 [Pseudomonadota bacterium]|jgi:hypothetical protein
MTIPNDINKFLDGVRSGRPVEFEQTIALIDSHYRFTPCRFANGEGDDRIVSEAGVNNGSLKIFTFASEHCLNEAETLSLFGKFYREDVLSNPLGEDHRNIRAFMKFGWRGVAFDGKALEAC